MATGKLKKFGKENVDATRTRVAKRKSQNRKNWKTFQKLEEKENAS